MAKLYETWAKQLE